MKKKEDKVKTGNITVKMDGKVVLDMSITTRGSFLKNFMSGFSTGASFIPDILSHYQNTCGGPLSGTIAPLPYPPPKANVSDFFKKATPDVPPMTKEEIDELIKKYSTPEEK